MSRTTSPKRKENIKNADYNHVPSSLDIQVKKTLNNLKDIASNNSDMSTQSVIGSALSHLNSY